MTLSPQIGELLLQATQSNDLDEALHKVLREYVELKLASLSSDISVMQEKWDCAFDEFRERTKTSYTYEIESAFWEWERLETLKSHYKAIQERWS